MSWWRRSTAPEPPALDPARLLEIESALAQGNLAEAEALLSRLPTKAFGFAAAHDVAARVHLAKADGGRAAECFETALALDPQDLCALCGLAELQERSGAHARAAELYTRALTLQPANAALSLKRASALLESGDRSAALTAAADAASNAVGNAAIESAVAMIYERCGLDAEAERLYRTHQASNHVAAAGVARTLRMRADFAGAEQAFRHAAELHPTGQYLLDVGIALFHQHQYRQAIDLLRGVVAERPDWADARLVLANALIANGELVDGWREYEARFHVPGSQWAPAPAPPWTGESLEGLTLLVDAEQGFGDSILAVRFLQRLRGLAARVVLRCPVELESLFRASDLADAVRPAREAVSADRYCRVLSLPHVLGISNVEELRAHSYLRAPETASALCALEDQTFNIGLVWSGRASAPQNRYRRFAPDAAVRTLAVDPRIRLYSLQVSGEGIEPCPEGVTDLAPHLSDFGATASLLGKLDLVITVESAIAHLAGALGVRAWIPYPSTADWRWSIAGHESPWYSTTRLFPQTQAGVWADVFERMGSVLGEMLLQRFGKSDTLTSAR